jgi:dihydroorotate dehydrogenase (NAD+) catalytic subunit
LSAVVEKSSTVDLAVQLGRLRLANPILVASGTFGYAKEMEPFVPLERLGGILPKTITAQPRIGNAPWRTVETSAGLLNSIGLDNDGIDTFIAHHLPYFRTLATPVIVSIAGKTYDEFVAMAAQLGKAEASACAPASAELQRGVAALELNISCPNVSGGVDFGTDPAMCRRVVAGVRGVCDLPILAKLSPNVSNIAVIAQAAEEGGADAISVINTLLGMAVDWKKRRPLLGNVMGGLSGPAIKPVALRCVHQVYRAVKIPIVGIGGIATIDDVMEFLVTGATAVQIGTANFYDPTCSVRILGELPAAIASLGAQSVRDMVGTIKLK